jgi:hypothetical protein
MDQKILEQWINTLELAKLSFGIQGWLLRKKGKEH